MAASRGHDNDRVLASMLASQRAGRGAMAGGLGLERIDFEEMLARHFPGFEWLAGGFDRDLTLERAPERDDLVRFLTEARAHVDESERWMAVIVAAGCMGANHLWQDLGLRSRPDLTALMRRNFPTLAARNVHDMKWKKFLYKQLCLAEGIYVCRSPTCEVCSDYDNCFGPED
jgi:nitrogen fixation protein NifQ